MCVYLYCVCYPSVSAIQMSSCLEFNLAMYVQLTVVYLHILFSSSLSLKHSKSKSYVSLQLIDYFRVINGSV